MDKFITVIIACYYCCLMSAMADSQSDEAAASINRCKERIGLSDDQLQQMREGGMILQDESSEKGRCFVECIMMEFNLLKDGQLNMEEVMKNSQEFIDHMKKKGKEVNDEVFKKQLEECGQKSGEGNCMTNYQIWKCFHDQMNQYMDN